MLKSKLLQAERAGSDEFCIQPLTRGRSWKLHSAVLQQNQFATEMGNIKMKNTKVRTDVEVKPNINLNKPSPVSADKRQRLSGMPWFWIRCSWEFSQLWPLSQKKSQQARMFARWVLQRCEPRCVFDWRCEAARILSKWGCHITDRTSLQSDSSEDEGEKKGKKLNYFVELHVSSITCWETSTNRFSVC